MANQKLTKWIETAYPYLKDGCGLPPWALPEATLSKSMDEVGDSGLLKVSQHLGLSQNVDGLINGKQDPSTVSPWEWQDTVNQWPYLSQTGSVFTAFVEVVEPVMAHFPKIRQSIDPLIICRSMAVLLLASLVEQGKGILAELATILGGQTDHPEELIAIYADAVTVEDIPILEKVEGCILKYKAWQKWAKAIQEEAANCRYMPRLIAVTPPLSTDLISVLATMLEEDKGESGRDYPGD